MMVLLWGFLSIVFLCVIGLYVWTVRIEKNVQRIMEVLSQASPDLERRVLEQGTRVVIGDKWYDDLDIPENEQ